MDNPPYPFFTPDAVRQITRSHTLVQASQP